MIIEKRIPIGYMLNKIKWELFIVSIFSTTIYFLLKHVGDINIPISISAFLGTAIALLLSFKLSQSYDRWWEARKVWGAIVNDSRSLIIQLRGFTQLKDLERIEKMADRQIAWCFSLSQSLRSFSPTDNIQEYISKKELDSILKHKNVPLALIDFHSQDLSELRQNEIINDFQYIQLDNTLVRLCTSMGQAERIKSTIFPKTYRLTLRLFIFFFLTLLSISLTEPHGLIEIPLVVFISIPFFLLEKIASYIQNPFENKPTDTAMTSISRTIEININHLMGKEVNKNYEVPDTFYIL